MYSNHRLFSIGNLSDTGTDTHNESTLSILTNDNYDDFSFIGCSNTNRDSNKHARAGLDHCK